MTEGCCSLEGHGCYNDSPRMVIILTKCCKVFQSYIPEMFLFFLPEMCLGSSVGLKNPGKKVDAEASQPGCQG